MNKKFSYIDYRIKIKDCHEYKGIQCIYGILKYFLATFRKFYCL